MRSLGVCIQENIVCLRIGDYVIFAFRTLDICVHEIIRYGCSCIGDQWIFAYRISFFVQEINGCF